AQGAARGLSDRQHDDGWKRDPQWQALRVVESGQPALSGEARRLPRAELREDHQDLGNQRGLPRNRARRGRRMDRAQQRPPASGEGAMKSIWEKSMIGLRLRYLALVAAACVAFPAWADNAVQAITSSQQGGSAVIRIEMAQPLAAVPNGFTVQAPPRIAIDLPGVTNALGK